MAATGRLIGRRCLIVGGTSGIGLAAAKRFVAEGASVVIAGLDDGRSSPDVQDLLTAGATVHALAADARNPQQAEWLLAETVARLGGLDVLYHVAGASGRRCGDGSLHECTDAGWSATLASNLLTVFHTNRAAVRYFLGRRQPGVILNVASVLALAPAPGWFDTAAYTAAKGGVIALSRLAAARYARDGIRVNVLCPGLMDTPMSQRAVRDPAIRRYLEARQPLTRGPGRPEDCAEAAVFLCSDAARWITGAVVPVDGGWCVADGVPPIAAGPEGPAA
ncbi:MAG: SDR family oxidoreductase [Gemmataceae bacterium]|nr:SDR family oxidoreductase [Gemmataceae bacterium]MDW8264307.1 SDR family oxidoreductase [Gemmataceae bacterium]